jgi:hypothetical protein
MLSVAVNFLLLAVNLMSVYPRMTKYYSIMNVWKVALFNYVNGPDFGWRGQKILHKNWKINVYDINSK